MEYKIKDPGEFYYPKTHRWIVETFNFKCIEAIAYQMILDKGYVTWTIPWFANVLGISTRTLDRMLEKMVNMGVILRRSINTTEEGVRMRTVTVALYDRDGKRDSSVINSLVSKGIERINLDYADRRAYKKKG